MPDKWSQGNKRSTINCMKQMRVKTTPAIRIAFQLPHQIPEHPKLPHRNRCQTGCEYARQTEVTDRCTDNRHIFPPSGKLSSSVTAQAAIGVARSHRVEILVCCFKQCKTSNRTSRQRFQSGFDCSAAGVYCRTLARSHLLDRRRHKRAKTLELRSDRDLVANHSLQGFRNDELENEEGP